MMTRHGLDREQVLAMTSDHVTEWDKAQLDMAVGPDYEVSTLQWPRLSEPIGTRLYGDV